MSDANAGADDCIAIYEVSERKCRFDGADVRLLHRVCSYIADDDRIAAIDLAARIASLLPLAYVKDAITVTAPNGEQTKFDYMMDQDTKDYVFSAIVGRRTYTKTCACTDATITMSLDGVVCESCGTAFVEVKR